jgi:hypothetical protein
MGVCNILTRSGIHQKDTTPPKVCRQFHHLPVIFRRSLETAWHYDLLACTLPKN